MNTPSENKSITEPSEKKTFVLSAGWRIVASGNPATDRVWGKAGVSGIFNLKQAFMMAVAKINPQSGRGMRTGMSTMTTGPSETKLEAPDENKTNKPKKKKGKKKKSVEE